MARVDLESNDVYTLKKKVIKLSNILDNFKMTKFRTQLYLICQIILKVLLFKFKYFLNGHWSDSLEK